jgi:hypothetical protein
LIRLGRGKDGCCKTFVTFLFGTYSTLSSFVGVFGGGDFISYRLFMRIFIRLPSLELDLPLSYYFFGCFFADFFFFLTYFFFSSIILSSGATVRVDLQN